jgi:hypothetical protein
MKAGGPAGGAFVVLGFVAVLAAAAFYITRERQQGQKPAQPASNGY